ncbi:hypothetical protein A4A49_59153, partial [Nicotiana attenuata]
YAIVIEDETKKGSSGHSSTGLNSLMEGNDITALWSAKGPQMQKPRKNYNIVCDFCKMKGHDKENCYQLIGYPTDFKGIRKPVANSAYFGNSTQLGNHGQYQRMGNNSRNEKDAGVSMQMPMPFTPEQYDQILKMLQKDSTPESTANAAGITGPLMLANVVSVTHSTDSKAKDDKWIVDIGATDHMVSNSEMI